MSYPFPVRPEDYLSLEHTRHAAVFEGCETVWEAVGRIANHLKSVLEPGNHGTVVGTAHIGDNVYIGEGAIIQPGAVVLGPAWIGPGAVVASGCYIRENVIIGDHAIAGNSSEFKNCVLFDRSEVPHFNYVGDSILGYRAHLAAGVILSNYRLDHAPIAIPDAGAPGGKIDTGLDKFGAVVGDRVDIGCNAVLSPGSLIGRGCTLYPGAHWRGYLAPNRLVKVRQTQEVVAIEKRD